MKKIILAVLLVLSFFAFQVALAGSKEEASKPAESKAKAPAPSVTKRGGILKVGLLPINTLDPHFTTSISDSMVAQQLYDGLVFIDQNNRPAPDLASKWNSSDGKVWTFTIRSNARFSNGQELTAADVVYSFNRLRNPKVGAPTVPLYKNIVDVKALDPTHVQFTLKTTNPEFPSDVGDYHALIISKNVKDPKKEWVCSGAFMIEKYVPGDRVILKRNPYYGLKGDDGKPLPYLDGAQLIFSPDMEGQVEALRGGQLQFVGGFGAQFAKVIKNDPSLRLLTNVSNMHWVLHMRSDKGHIASDNRIREALKLATDQKAIIQAVRPGLAVVGNGFTPVGPAYKDYYLNKPPVPNIEKAKKLLAEAGYPNGLKITLYAYNRHDAIGIATVWKSQMAKIGVDVDINVIPASVYYGTGDQSWLKCDFGLTDWGSRATPVTYFKLAYKTGVKWNESHWSDAELDKISDQIDSEMDKAKRIELYKKAQEIFIERGPIIVPYFMTSVAGVSANVKGITLPAAWAQVRFRNAYYIKK